MSTELIGICLSALVKNNKYKTHRKHILENQWVHRYKQMLRYERTNKVQDAKVQDAMRQIINKIKDKKTEKRGHIIN